MKYIGIDEAGRGTLFGSVFAGAVIWDDKIDSSSFTDSKKMSKKNRAIARQYIEDNAIAFGVGFATNKEVDYINMDQLDSKSQKKRVLHKCMFD